MPNVICPYCGKKAEYIDSSRYYLNGVSYGMIYICRHCDATVGVHKGTNTPLGTLANKDLRKLRKECHDLFDTLWRGKARRSRQKAYAYMARLMDIDIDQAHIGMFREEDCELLIEKLKARKK